MKPVDIQPDSYAKYNVNSNDEDPKCIIGDHVIISKYNIVLLEDLLIIGKKMFLL